MKIIVIAEHEQGSLKPATLNAIGAAQELSQATKASIHVCVIGHQCDAIAAQLSHLSGVESVKVADDPRLLHPLAERVAKIILSIAPDYDYILAPATTFGKNCLPRVAACLDVMQISDVIKIHNGDTFDRPIYAGNAIATVQSQDSIKVMTIRPTAFSASSTGDKKATIESIAIPSDLKDTEAQSTYVSLEASASERPDLTSARIVVSGGRALSSKENFVIIEDLADCLKAAIGASRAAVDAGYVPNDYQVGQTGKVVAPELYIAVGISGAIQHLAGMKESKTIIAINKDPDAPIFQIADYGYVGDLFEVVPQLTQALCGEK